ncbi:phosphotransferase enzyme family protein [Oceanobacillus piezotolerans]|uniref:phosphotransferase enzyme family protein n=1 Tax=Oceanobacillus piezotolerans TaxID=2448030 RepID=UPI0013145745|nr:phosphotransferase [Oceanobacillus piezotolerans]
MDKASLSKGAEKFDVDGLELQLLGGFSNNVFECNRDGESIILKFYPSYLYRKDSIIAELDWIRYLHSSGVYVTRPLLSNDGKYIETIKIDNEKECYVLAFEKAKGSFINVNDAETWNKDFYYIWGKALGKIHCLSKNYSPLDKNIKKQEWNMGPLFSDNFNEVSKGVFQRWGKFVNELNKLPKNKSGYGMIHNDLHQGNFYVHNNKIILFDFGDCEYNWFIYDIAIVLYHAVQSIEENDIKGREEFAHLFIEAFLEGYLTENNLDSYWLSKLPFFLNYRRIFSYIYFAQFLNEEQKNNMKVKDKLNGMKEKIESDVPYLEIHCKDFF